MPGSPEKGPDPELVILLSDSELETPQSEIRTVKRPREDNPSGPAREQEVL